jgi:hypothetical protein
MTSPQRTVLEASDNGGSTLPRSGWALVLPGRDDRRLPRNQIVSSVDSLAFPFPTVVWEPLTSARGPSTYFSAYLWALHPSISPKVKHA